MKFRCLTGILLFFFSCVCIAQEGISFENLTYEEALVKARETGKKVFVDCYTKTCGPCKYMARVIFPQKVCGDYFNPLYISLMKDMEEGDGIDIAQKYQVRMYPTYLILNTDGSLFLRYEGGAERNPDVFIRKIKDHLLLVEWNAIYERGDYDDAFLQKYMDLLERYDSSRLQEIMEETMLGWDIERLCEPTSWYKIKAQIKNPENMLFQHVLEYRDEFIQKLGKSEVENALLSVFSEEFRVCKMMNLDLNRRMNDLRKLENDDFQGAKALRYRMLIYQIINDKWSDRIDEIIEILKNLEPEIPNSIDRVAILTELSGIDKLITDKLKCEELHSLLSHLTVSLSAEQIKPVLRIMRLLEGRINDIENKGHIN